MKVYVKRKDREPIFPLIILICLFSLPIIIFSIFIIQSEKKTLEDFVNLIMPIITIIIFSGFELMIISAFLKKPKYYKARLIEKTQENYFNKPITYMLFKVEETDQINIPLISEYYCYTKNENNLTVGKEYAIKVKEVIWKALEVNELNNIKNGADKVPKVSLKPVFIAIGLLMAGAIITSIFGIIIYTEYSYIYIAAIVLYLYGLYQLKFAKQQQDKQLQKDEDFIKMVKETTDEEFSNFVEQTLDESKDK